jgi:uncharacterized protein YjiS (DUF1127 family)
MSTRSISLGSRIAPRRFSVRGVLNMLTEADARYRSRMGLNALDDHALRDIGISRADVDAELRRGAIW